MHVFMFNTILFNHEQYETKKFQCPRAGPAPAIPRKGENGPAPDARRPTRLVILVPLPCHVVWPTAKDGKVYVAGSHP